MRNFCDEYRQKAEECRVQARKAPRPEDKAAWLSMAEDWLRLAESVPTKVRSPLPPASHDGQPFMKAPPGMGLDENRSPD
jgi:hypothetical protein